VGPLGLVRLACAAGRSRRQAAGACEPRAALKAHASLAYDSGRLISALRGRRGGGRTNVVLIATSSSALCLFRAVRLRACATAERGKAAASALDTRPAMESRAHISEFTLFGRCVGYGVRLDNFLLVAFSYKDKQHTRTQQHTHRAHMKEASPL